MKKIIYSSKELFLFALPIIFGQLGQMLIGAGDTLIAAKYSTDTVAAAGLAGGIISPLFVAGLGFLAGASPILATKRGKGQDVDKYLASVILYSIGVAVVVQIVALLLIPLVPYFGMDKQLVPLVKEYTFYFSFSFMGAYLFQGFKEFLQSFEDVVIPNALSIAAVFLNLGLNTVLVFGVGPFPELGIKGLAFSSIIIRTVLAISLFIYARKHLHGFKIIPSFYPEVLRLSIPISFTVGVEVAAYCVSTIIIGNLGTVQTAAHNLVLTLASITFMVPLAISSAVAVKVGHAHGERDFGRVKQFIESSLFLAVLFMFFSGTVFLLFPEFLLNLFTADSVVISVGVPLLFLIALSQLVDGFQITLTGVLRGLGETKIVFIITLVAYWVIGIPFGTYLAFNEGFKAKGIWIGLIVGLVLIAISLLFLLKKRIRLVRSCYE